MVAIRKARARPVRVTSGRKWFSVLKPSGMVLIVYGNMDKETWVKGLTKPLA